MNREKGLIDAWDACMEPESDDERTTPHPLFASAFNAGWDALMSEIRPLVADLYTLSPISSHPIHAPDDKDLAHNATVKRLRDLVREERHEMRTMRT